MDIFLTNKSDGNILQFPMLPEKINCSAASNFQSYDILQLGEVKIPDGDTLTNFSWECILPGEKRKNANYIREYKEPKQIQEQLSVFRSKGIKLRLLVTETPINHDVYLNDYSVVYSGSHGDYLLNISFVVAKDITVNLNDVNNINNNAGEAERPTENKGTYTVKAGDSMWAIAQSKLGNGSLYPKLYEANKALIDEYNKKYKTSKYTIYPGQVFILP